MSKLEVDAIEPQSGTTLTLGASGDAVALGSGASVSGLTLSDNILFNAASKGIYLGVTSATASNLLDDYEEGTWTPEFADAASGGNTATGTFSGTYTKIGRLVNVSMLFSNINTTGLTSGNNIAIRNFPFTIQNSAIGSVVLDRFDFTNFVTIEAVSSETRAILRDNIDSTPDAILTVASVTASGGSDLLATVTYETA